MIPNDFPPSPPASGAGPPKGNLEELFRHHLADAGAAPRPLVWERLDNALLVRQNESYRRRLVATRWVAAASLLLATLAGAGWWARQMPAGPAVATAGQPWGAAGALGGPKRPPTGGAGTQRGALPGTSGPTNSASRPAAMGSATAAAGPAIGRRSSSPWLAAAGTKAWTARGGGRPETVAPPAAALRAAAPADNQPGGAAPRPRPDMAFNAGPPRGSQAFAGAALHRRAASDDGGTLMAVSAGAPSTGRPSAWGEAWGLLALRPAALAGAPLVRPLPTGLAVVAVVPNVAAPLRRWQFGASYTAGVFHPNADFSQATNPTATAIPYSSAAATSALSLTNRSAAEYRAYLHGGLDQRVSLRATRLLGGHWALSTGLELAQHEAQSATSTSFVGEQLLDYAYAFAPPATLRTTSFRYRTAGVPVELRYANPVKRGWSAYGRVGAVVSALLNVRSEVADEPQATKTYSLTAAGSPYRRLLTTLRGGAGVQYRPATGRWALSAGPTAELGVLSLNAQPVQDFAHQRRPYSFGLEAAVDFGGAVKRP